jgi:Chromate transporter
VERNHDARCETAQGTDLTLGASHDDYDNGPEGRIGELVRYFLRLGCLGFGGPVALVGQMERELVNDRQWLTKEQMREAIAICQSLPRTACHSGRHLCVLPA